jgi:hypothetical protein
MLNRRSLLKSLTGLLALACGVKPQARTETRIAWCHPLPDSQWMDLDHPVSVEAGQKYWVTINGERAMIIQAPTSGYIRKVSMHTTADARSCECRIESVT